MEFQSFVFGLFWADFGNFKQFWAVLGRNCCIDSGWDPAQSVAEIFKTP
jgi:hypothetical protein